MPDFPMLSGIQPDGLPFRDTRSPYATHAERLRFGQTNVRDGARVAQAEAPRPVETPMPAPKAAAAPTAATGAERERLPSGRVFTDEPGYATRIQPRTEAPAATRVPTPQAPARGTASQGAPPVVPPANAAAPARPEAMRLQSLLDGIIAAGPRVPPPTHRRVAGDLTEADTDDLFDVADPDEVADTGATARAPGER